MAETITLRSPLDGFAFTALHAAPQGPRQGGVIVIQEIFGLDSYVTEDVARWSALGFEVIAPSMFDRQQKGFIAGHDEQGYATGLAYARANGVENPVADVQACVDALKDKGPVFLVGYCYGGTVAWRAAAQVPGLAAVSSYYGSGVAGLADLVPACPVICHFGRKDAHIPADQVAETLQKAHPDVPVYIYEQSGHGFNNDGRPDSNREDAQLARKRTADLFRANA
ncbi:dienelactone hydrolase family protein [Nitrospirillum sp. BR 11828]|uniref:dienelactone hydrolase family protein n=1 Tax=Nitrospirillum sp. BR 11828 TaxID=3104325 RepID=UPI002ACA04C5|nr:dienelactone hydrolase family protein [Nitrospirillum sp. BR 11828]MDZ5646167.1 dienelactone hydrolase family protein [Nitrospirillum sp. BR 11828]